MDHVPLVPTSSSTQHSVMGSTCVYPLWKGPLVKHTKTIGAFKSGFLPLCKRESGSQRRCQKGEVFWLRWWYTLVLWYHCCCHGYPIMTTVLALWCALRHHGYCCNCYFDDVVVRLRCHGNLLFLLTYWDTVFTLCYHAMAYTATIRNCSFKRGWKHSP